MKMISKASIAVAAMSLAGSAAALAPAAHADPFSATANDCSVFLGNQAGFYGSNSCSLTAVGSTGYSMAVDGWWFVTIKHADNTTTTLSRDGGDAPAGTLTTVAGDTVTLTVSSAANGVATAASAPF